MKEGRTLCLVFVTDAVTACAQVWPRYDSVICMIDLARMNCISRVISRVTSQAVFHIINLAPYVVTRCHPGHTGNKTKDFRPFFLRAALLILSLFSVLSL